MFVSPFANLAAYLGGSMVNSRLEKGVSDPVSYECSCSAREQGHGVVLLFYRYYANHPALSADILVDVDRVNELATWHRELTKELNIIGKIRVASEGFNVTVGGTRSAIQSYITACTEHWSFDDLPLSTEAEQNAFFKPSAGCACAFHPATETSVRVCAEITPLGITNYAPSHWTSVEELPPAEFHRRCHQEDIALLDLRNHYESKIGYFINPQTGETALKPQIRRFSQWPRYFKTREEEVWSGCGKKGQLLTYCTGGIRCEKATRWMADRQGSEEGRRISTLQGGIAAYLDWVAEEISAGRMTAQESLFKGKNYVFDARGATGLNSHYEQPVSHCHVCGVASDRLDKCRSTGCHLVLVVCPVCEPNDPRCCSTCQDHTMTKESSSGPRGMCSCEKMREHDLWSSEQVEQPTRQGRRKSSTKPKQPQLKSGP